MSVQNYCDKCFSSTSLGATKCKKCGAFFKGKGRKYRVAVYVGGQRVSKVVDSLKLAKELDAAFKADLLRGNFDLIQKPPEIPTLGAIWDRYIKWAKEHKKSWLTDLKYYQKHIEPRFSKKNLDKISPIHLEKLKSDLKKGLNKRGVPYAPQTIKHQLVIIRRLFNLAAKWGLYTGPNPVSQVQLPKIDNQITEFLTDEQLTNLLIILDNWPKPDTVAFIKFALFTGLRRGELFKLKWSDVDFDKHLITLRKPKGGVTVTLPISSQAIDVINDLPRSSEYVFPGKDGEMRNNFSGPWQRIREAAGLPKDFRFHGLRHHFASTLVSHGADLMVVKELLTHKDAKTTQRYAHLAPGAVRQAAELAGKLISDPKNINKFSKQND